MTELTPEEAAASARAAEQARIRKAKREAKLKAGAEDRWNKINGLGGRKPDPEPTTTTTTTSATAAAATATAQPTFGPVPPPGMSTADKNVADPDEVDISVRPAQHFYQPNVTSRIPTPQGQAGFGRQQQQQGGVGGGMGGISEEQMLRQMLLGFDPSSNAGPGAGAGAGAQDDPMLQMMRQMLGGGGGGGGPGATNPFAAMAGMPGFPPQQQQQQGQQDGQQVAQPKYQTAFRMLHTALALALGLYIAFWTPFTGRRDDEREYRGKGDDGEMAKRFLWAFATGEALLLSGRYFLDGQGTSGASGAGGGLMGMLVGFLPQPLKGRVEMAIRYGDVVNRVKGDVLVVVFVLGCVSWLRG